MKTLLTTSALILALGAPMAAPVMAQDAPVSPYREGVEKGVRASDFIGKRVYLTEADTSNLSATAIANANTDWQDAGEISDVMISLSGDTEVVLVDFGGFLGIGEKTVAIDMNQLTLVPDSGSPQDYFIVFHGNKTALEGAPAYNPDMAFDATDAAVTPVPAQPAMDTAEVEAPTPDTPATGSVMTGGMTDGATVDFAVMTDADLIGQRVYGPNEEDVGEVSAVVLDAEGKITGAVVDVGGFLGMGEKPVALSADQLMLVADADGDGHHLRVNATQAQLEALPVYVN